MPQAKRNADEALIAALACGATVESAGRSAGLSPRTVHRRLNAPEFRQRLEAFRTDLVQRTAASVTAANLQAVKTLIELQDGATPPSVRLGAARALLEFGIKLRESAEMEQRLAALEQLVKPGENTHAHRTPAEPSVVVGETAVASTAPPGAVAAPPAPAD